MEKNGKREIIIKYFLIYILLNAFCYGKVFAVVVRYYCLATTEGLRLTN